MNTLKQKLNELNPKRRKKIEIRAAQLIAQEMTGQGAPTGSPAHTGAPRQSSGRHSG